MASRQNRTPLGARVTFDPAGARAELVPVIVEQRGNVASVARALGVSVETLWRWIRVLDLGDAVQRAREASRA